MPMSVPNLRSLTLEIENGAADYWSGRYVNEKRLVSISEAEEHVTWKAREQLC